MTTMKIYAAGGTGCNIGSAILKHLKDQVHLTANIDAVFIDTSRSNLNPSIPASKTYLFEDLNGSGKLRASNYQVLNEHSREILLQHKPADINIILSSGAGGSGSVIGPILTSEMLSRGEYVIVVTVGSTASRIETENTLKTLHSYETISQKRNLPVVMSYLENSAETPRGQIDREIIQIVTMLAVIFSDNNHELDMSDLRNFINYHKVTNYSPRLSYLSIVTGTPITIARGQPLVSLVTLSDGETSTEPGVLTEYQAVGYLPTSVRDLVKGDLPLHAAVISGYFKPVVERLEGKLREYDALRSAVVERSIVGNGVQSTDDGIVL